MAEIPALSVPEAQPRPTPAGGFRVEALPGTFGAIVAGKSLEGTGAALTQGAEAQFSYANALQDLNNKAASDTAGSDFATKSRELVDQWQQANPGAKALTPNAQGVTPYEEFGQQLDTMRTGLAKQYNLSPIATALYEEQTRRLQSLVLGDANSYAHSQQHIFQVTASKAQVETLQNQMAMRPTDLNFIEGVHSQIAQEILHQQILTGMSDQETQLQILNDSSKGLARVVSDLGVHDPSAADALLKQYETRGWISPTDKGELDRTLHGPLVQQGAAQAATQAFGMAVAGIAAAIIHQESGGNPNVHDSAAGAVGPGQIEPRTFARFAQPGEDIRNPQDNLNVANRIINHYSQEYGGDPARVAVAYYSGEGNVAPPGSPTPWKHDIVPKAGGPSVSGYVQQVLARASGSPIAAIETQLPSIQADAKTRADAWADAHGIDRSEMETAVSEHTQQQYAHAKYTYDQQQTATAGSILTTIEKGDTNGNPISDMDTLLKAPGMQQAFASLTPADQRNVERQVYQNANMWTFNRQTTMQDLIGRSQNDPIGFSNANLLDPSLDVRRSDRVALLKRQSELRASMQKGGYTETNRMLHEALMIPSIKLSIPTDPNAQNQYVGALTTELEGWAAANPGKRPSLNDYNAIAQKITTSAGGFLGIGGHPAYVDIATQRATVPEAFRAATLNYALSHGYVRPTEVQIEDTYRRTQK